MAHFAELNESNEVIQVIVVSNEDTADVDGNEVEAIGIQFCVDLLGGRWIQTSYNANFRGHFAGGEMTYDEDLDEFVLPPPSFFNPADSPYLSWVWVTESVWGPHWGPPIAYPGALDADGIAVEPSHTWDEDTTSWIEPED